MSDKLTAVEACQIAESAFEPLCCAASSEDHGNVLRIEIRDASDTSALHATKLTSDQFKDPRRFADNIGNIRRILKNEGHSLVAWQFSVQ